MYLSVPIREAKPGAVQEPHHAEGLQYQRPYWRGGHPCVDAHAAVLAGKPSYFALTCHEASCITKFLVLAK